MRFNNALGLTDTIWYAIIGGTVIAFAILLLCCCMCIRKTRRKYRRQQEQQQRPIGLPVAPDTAFHQHMTPGYNYASSLADRPSIPAQLPLFPMTTVQKKRGSSADRNSSSMYDPKLIKRISLELIHSSSTISSTASDASENTKRKGSGALRDRIEALRQRNLGSEAIHKNPVPNVPPPRYRPPSEPLLHENNVEEVGHQDVNAAASFLSVDIDEKEVEDTAKIEPDYSSTIDQSDLSYDSSYIASAHDKDMVNPYHSPSLDHVR